MDFPPLFNYHDATRLFNFIIKWHKHFFSSIKVHSTATWKLFIRYVQIGTIKLTETFCASFAFDVLAIFSLIVTNVYSVWSFYPAKSTHIILVRLPSIIVLKFLSSYSLLPLFRLTSILIDIWTYAMHPRVNENKTNKKLPLWEEVSLE